MQIVCTVWDRINRRGSVWWSRQSLSNAALLLEPCHKQLHRGWRTSRKQHVWLTSQKPAHWPQSHGTAWHGGSQPLHAEKRDHGDRHVFNIGVGRKRKNNRQTEEMTNFQNILTSKNIFVRRIIGMLIYDRCVTAWTWQESWSKSESWSLEDPKASCTQARDCRELYYCFHFMTRPD